MCFVDRKPRSSFTSDKNRQVKCLLELNVYTALGPYFTAQHNLFDPRFLHKKLVCLLSHLVPEILGPKVCLII